MKRRIFANRQYKGFSIQETPNEIVVRDSRGKYVVSVDTDDEATDYIDSLINWEEDPEDEPLDPKTTFTSEQRIFIEHESIDILADEMENDYDLCGPITSQIMEVEKARNHYTVTVECTFFDRDSNDRVRGILYANYYPEKDKLEADSVQY